ncbi:MAG: hypothetical protein AB7I48_05790 [Planctomycetaceae bacterium]
MFADGVSRVAGRRLLRVYVPGQLSDSQRKFFRSPQVVGRKGVTLRWLLRVAFGRWSSAASTLICRITASRRNCGTQLANRNWKNQAATNSGPLRRSSPTPQPASGCLRNSVSTRTASVPASLGLDDAKTPQRKHNIPKATLSN